MFIKWSNFRDKRKSSDIKWHQTGGVRWSIKRWEIRFFKRRLGVVFLPVLWITFETETMCSNFKLYHQRNTEFHCCVGHEQAVGVTCTIVYIYMVWKSSLKLLPLEIQENVMKKLVSYSVSGIDLNQNQRKCRECFSFTPRTLLQLLYKLWITTIAKYILIELKNICGKTFVTKVERRLIVEIKWAITFTKSFIWFCVPSNTPHHIWPEFPNFIGLETIWSDSKHHLRVNGL